jgi:hypothetical protein
MALPRHEGISKGKADSVIAVFRLTDVKTTARISSRAASVSSRNPRMYRQNSTFLGLRTHHIVIALIASLIAIALVSNYYLW